MNVNEDVMGFQVVLVVSYIAGIVPDAPYPERDVVGTDATGTSQEYIQ